MDRHVAARNLSPACGMASHIHVQKSAIIGANAALRKLWDRERKFVHALQAESGQPDVGRFPQKMLAVGLAAHRPIVFRAPIGTLHNHRACGPTPQSFQC